MSTYPAVILRITPQGYRLRVKPRSQMPSFVTCTQFVVIMSYWGGFRQVLGTFEMVLVAFKLGHFHAVYNTNSTAMG